MVSWVTARQTYSLTPVDVAGLASGVAAIATGGDHTCALTASGGVKCWGGTGMVSWVTAHDSSYSLTPMDVAGLASGVTAIAAGWEHTCALTAGGGVKCWGVTTTVSWATARKPTALPP